MTYDSEVLADSPRFYYSTTEASGTITDDSGNGFNLTLPGGSPTYAQAGPLGALDAMSWPDSAGGTEYYAVTSTNIGSTRTALTPECWFYYSGTPPTNPTALCGVGYTYGNSSHRPALLYVGTDGKIHYWWGNNATSGLDIASASTLSTGWHHVAAPTTSTTAKIRLDKADVASGSHATSIDSTGVFYVHGGSNSSSYVNLTNCSVITISKPALYVSTLSDARIDAHFDAMSQSASVTVPVASATAAGVVPAVSAGSGVVVPAAGSSAAAVVPAVTGTGDATVLVPVATGAGAALPPAVSAGADVVVPAATASGAAVAPVVAATSSASVVVPVATATAGAIAPFVFNGSPDATVSVPVATATAAGHAPLLGVTGTADTSNAFSGRSRDGYATLELTVPVVPPPAVSTTYRVDKAVPLPLPVLVNGRPT